MKKGTIAVLVSVWLSVAGTGIGLAALITTGTGRLDTRISELDARLSGQISELAKGQAELRERMIRVETILEEGLAVAEVKAPNGENPASSLRPAMREREASESLQ